MCVCSAASYQWIPIVWKWEKVSDLKNVSTLKFHDPRWNTKNNSSITLYEVTKFSQHFYLSKIFIYKQVDSKPTGQHRTWRSQAFELNFNCQSKHANKSETTVIQKQSTPKPVSCLGKILVKFVSYFLKFISLSHLIKQQHVTKQNAPIPTLLHFFTVITCVCVHVMCCTTQTNILRRQNFAVCYVDLTRHHQKVISILFSQKNILLTFNLPD